MNIEYYRNFIAIVEAGSISAAAKRVAVAQPALSNQLKTLQKKFGTPLLNLKRGGHTVELTEAGCILYNKAKYICSTEDNIIKEIADCAGGFSGTLRLSLSPSMSISFIKNYLSRFSRQYPQINYELYERKRDRLIALFHKDSPYLNSNKPHILLDDLEDVPLCLSRGCSTLFLNTCSDSRLLPQVLSINTTKLSTIAWATQNIGVAIVPAEKYELFDPCLVPKQIEDERLFVEKTLSVVKGRPLSTVAKTFVNFFLENF